MLEKPVSIEKLISIIDDLFPIPKHFASGLPLDVRELSELFTSRRSERTRSYLGKPNLLSAYLRYFLPWNVFRLCKLLASLPLDLKDGDTVLDIGGGPLTFAISLWISRPEFRKTSLEFVVIDRTPRIMEAGKKILAALFRQDETDEDGSTGSFNDIKNNVKWKIKTIHGEISKKGFFVYRGGRRVFIYPEKILYARQAALVSAVNVFNEIYWDLSPQDKTGLVDLAEQTGNVLGLCVRSAGSAGSVRSVRSARSAGSVFIAEPGIPRSGEFISYLRSSFLNSGFSCISPCVHENECPFPGGMISGKNKAKWCHFSFITIDAPQRLLWLSEAAGIPKDRAVLSYLFMSAEKINSKTNGKQMDGKPDSSRQNIITARIVSDMFPLGDQFGRYACTECGPVLVTGSGRKIEALDSCTCANVKITGQVDQKSGALIGVIYGG